MNTNDIARVLEAHAATCTTTPKAGDILGRIHSKRHAATKRRRTLLFAVVLLLASMVAAGAMGAPILDAAVTREDGDFTLSYESESPVDVPSRTYTDAHRQTWGDELCDFLEAHGHNVLLPAWKPDGYAEITKNIRADDAHGASLAYCSYVNPQEQYLMLTIQTFPASGVMDFGRDSSYSMNEGEEPRLYEVNGRRVYWGKNMDMDTVFWLDVGGEVCISGGPLGDETVEKMIESME